MKEKYLHEIGSRKGAFAGELEGKTGAGLVIHLMETAKIPIRRHRLLQGEANPYDPAWEAYFDERIGAKWQEHWLKRRKLIALWREQEGKGPICDQKITRESGWRLDHIHPRV